MFQPLDDIADDVTDGQSPLGVVSGIYNRVGYVPPVQVKVADQAAAICTDIKNYGPVFAEKALTQEGADPSEAAVVVAAVNSNLCNRDRDDWAEAQQ